VTAPTNKARKFADAATALGWTVAKRKDDDGTLYAMCRRGNEQFNVCWVPGERGLVFDGGWHWVGEDATVLDIGAAQVLKEMGKIEQIDLRDLDDATVLAHLTDRTIYWTNSISGVEESAHIPANSQHSKIEVKRAITFVTAEGFRSVAIDKITAVK
jgi:hypothetical protein